MALGYSWTFLGQSNPGYIGGANFYTRIYAKLNSQDAINNTSNVSYRTVGYYEGYYVDDYQSNGAIIGTGASAAYGSNTRWWGGETVLCETSGTVTHESNGTKTVSASGTINMPNWGWSGVRDVSVELPSIDRTSPVVSLSTSNVTANSVYISASSNSESDTWEYSTNNGSSWSTLSSSATSQVSTTLSGLSPATTYNIKVRARRTYNHVTGTSSASSVTTLGGAVINSIPTFVADGGSLVFNGTFYNASYTNKLILKKGSTTVLSEFSIGTQSVGARNVTVSLTSAQLNSIYSAMPTEVSATFNLEIKSYSGSTLIGGSNNMNFTITLQNSSPTLNNFTFADTNSTTIAITGSNQILIQNKSTLRISGLSGSVKNGASISSWTYQVGTDTKTGSPSSGNYNFGVVSTYGNLTITVTLTDSRGLSVSKTLNVTVWRYDNVSIDSYYLKRVNTVEASTSLTMSGSTTSLNGGNILQTFRYKYRVKGTENWGSWTSKTVTKTSSSFSYNATLQNFDTDKEYEIYLEASDKLSTTYVIATLLSGTYLMMFRGNKVGINENNPTYTLDVQSATPNADPTFRLGSLDLRETFHDVGNAIGMQGWNQLIQNGNFANTNGWSTSQATFSASGNIASIACWGTYGYVKRQVALVNGHKYFLSFYSALSSANANIKVGLGNTAYFELEGVIASLNGDGAGDWHEHSIIGTFTKHSSDSGENSIVIMDFRSSFDTFWIKNLMCVDLTALFGSGNEPSTVAEFKQLFNADYYPYFNKGFELLWTNSNASSFSAGRVDVPCSNYDFILITFRLTSGGSTFVSSVATLNTNNLVQGGWEFNEVRSYDVNPSNVYFYGGYIYFSYGGSASSRNDRLIPYQIYGIKL